MKDVQMIILTVSPSCSSVCPALFSRLMLLPLLRNSHEDLLTEHGEDFWGETTHHISCFFLLGYCRLNIVRYVLNIRLTPLLKFFTQIIQTKQMYQCPQLHSSKYSHMNFTTNSNGSFSSLAWTNTQRLYYKKHISHSPDIFLIAWGFFHL